MRKIKFRVWDRKEQEMIYNALEITNFGLGDGSLLVDVKAQRGNELDWMQFTGLKDMTDREIYEFCELNNQWVVEYIAPCFVLKNIFNGDVIQIWEGINYEITREYVGSNS